MHSARRDFNYVSAYGFETLGTAHADPRALKLKGRQNESANNVAFSQSGSTSATDSTLRSGTDNHLVYINIGRLLDGERNRTGNCIGRQRELVPGLGELGLYVRIRH